METFGFQSLIDRGIDRRPPKRAKTTKRVGKEDGYFSDEKLMENTPKAKLLDNAPKELVKRSLARSHSDPQLLKNKNNSSYFANETHLPEPVNLSPTNGNL